MARHRKKATIFFLVAILSCLAFFGNLQFLQDYKDPQLRHHIASLFASQDGFSSRRTLDRGMLKIMQDLGKQREGEMIDPEARDAFVDRIRRSVIMEVIRELVYSHDINVPVEDILNANWDYLKELLADEKTNTSTKANNKIIAMSSFWDGFTKLLVENSIRKKSGNTRVNDNGDIAINNNDNNGNNGGDKSSYPSFIYSNPVINPLETTYTFYQSHACHNNASSHSIDVIIAVPSAPDNFERRQLIRESDLARYAGDPQNRAKLLFFLGSPDPSLKKFSKTTQNSINKEELQNGDIVQATFIDSYKNLTKKAAMIFHWSSTFCANAKYLMRNDDDCKGNMAARIKSMEIQSTKEKKFILGTIKTNMLPVRDINSRWAKYYLSYEEFPDKNLPPFLVGGALGYTMNSVDLLLETMRRIPLLWLDDVFVTGICAQKVGVPIYNTSTFLFEHGDKFNSNDFI